MKIPQRKAVSPIIATLLLIAITVAAGVVVYVFVGGLSASLSKTGSNQVNEQLSQDAYSFANPSSTSTALTLILRNTGSGTVTLASIYYNGAKISGAQDLVHAAYRVTSECGTGYTVPGPATNSTISVGSTCALVFAMPTGGTASASGTSNQLKVVTLDGALFTYNVIAGSSG